MKLLVPLARANAGACERLVEKLVARALVGETNGSALSRLATRRRGVARAYPRAPVAQPKDR
jgi:hypothetical protein